MVPFSIKSADNGNISRDEHVCIPKDTVLPLGHAADFTSRHPKSESCIDMHISPMYLTWPRANNNTRSQVLDTERRRNLREATMAPTGGVK